MSEISKFEQYLELQKKSSMLNWYSRLSSLDIPKPKTKVVLLKAGELQKFLNCDKLSNFEDIEKICDDIGYPVFVRSDQASAKHSWNSTCFVENKVKLEKNLWELLCQNELCELNDKAIIIREFLDLEIAFTAFGSGFPVSKEFRCFINHGELQCIHPYWFEEVIEKQGMVRDVDWKKKLAQLNTLTPEDLKTIKSHLTEVCKEFKDYWSVDFAKGLDGKWYLLDMAAGEVSYHYPKCKFSEDTFQ